jgi:NAD-dependent dihydropyrimidine dehydrogenase PreA subunit
LFRRCEEARQSSRHTDLSLVQIIEQACHSCGICETTSSNRE